jgi:hypothetical protein
LPTPALLPQRLNFFGGPPLASEDRAALSEAEKGGERREDRLVVCADVWLDQPATLTRISRMLSGEVCCLQGGLIASEHRSFLSKRCVSA